jgi:DNA-binding transcriptional LysR family regulator
MTSTGPEVLDAVRMGRAQLGVTVVTERPDDLEGRVLARVGAKVVMAKGHPLARRRRVTPRHLDGEPLILPPRGRPHREAVLRMLADAGVSPLIAVEAHGWEVLMRYAGLGLGVAIVNGICEPPRGLVTRPFVGLPRIAYWLLCRPGGRRRLSVAAAWDEIVAV